MKRVLLIVIYHIFVLAVYGEAEPPITCSIEDSLRLDTLYKEVLTHRVREDRLVWVQKLLNEARRLHSKYYEAEALMGYAQHYYTVNIDSLPYWSQLAYPALLESSRIDDFFRVKAWNIYASNRAKTFDRSLQLVDSLKLLAKEMDYPDGSDMADQALADLYLSRGLKEEGVNLYKEVLLRFEKNNKPLAKQVNIIRLLMIYGSDDKERLVFIKKMEEIVKRCEKDNIEYVTPDLPIYLLEYSVERDYLVSYVNLEMTDKIGPHFEALLKIAKEHNINPERIDYLQIKAIVYNILGDYVQAEAIYTRLAEISLSSNSIRDYTNRLWDLAQVQMKSHKYKQAADNFIRCNVVKDSLANERFDTELAKVHAQHDIDRLKLENTQMELQVSQANSRQWKFYSITGLLSLLCLLLAYVSRNRHKISLQMKKARDKAEEADRLKSAFLANMNHEIRTPLNAIVGFSQVLVSEEDPEERQMMANIIQSNNELLQRLIEDVLDISKIESNNMEFRYTDVDLSVLINEIYNAACLRMPAHVEARIDLSGPLTLKTDRNRLTQIITNFVNNSIKHTKEGFIRIGYMVENEAVKFFVQDTGEGIPADKLDSVFSRFVKLDDWSQGVGLGLAISKGLVDKLGGTIGVTSVYGEGCTFTVTFPLSAK